VFHSDSLITYPVGEGSPLIELLRATKRFPLSSIEQAVLVNRIGDIGNAYPKNL